MTVVPEHRAELVAIAERRDARIARFVTEAASVTHLRVWIQTKLTPHGPRGMRVGQIVTLSPRDESGMRVLTCGESRAPGFTRRDGLKCSFTFNLKVLAAKEVQIYSYAFEVTAPDDHPMRAAYLRWEYSPTRKENVDALREPLAHVHPGDDDARIPSPVLTPKELIAQFLELPWGPDA